MIIVLCSGSNAIAFGFFNIPFGPPIVQCGLTFPRSVMWKTATNDGTPTGLGRPVLYSLPSWATRIQPFSGNTRMLFIRVRPVFGPPMHPIGRIFPWSVRFKRRISGFFSCGGCNKKVTDRVYCNRFSSRSAKNLYCSDWRNIALSLQWKYQYLSDWWFPFWVLLKREPGRHCRSHYCWKQEWNGPCHLRQTIRSVRNTMPGL